MLNETYMFGKKDDDEVRKKLWKSNELWKQNRKET